MGMVAFVAVLGMVTGAWAERNITCRSSIVNAKGVNKADVAITAAAATVADAKGGRCELAILNTGFEDIRCTSSLDGDPTATAGFLIYAGLGIILGNVEYEGRHAWKCIRAASAAGDSTVSVLEVMP